MQNYVDCFGERMTAETKLSDAEKTKYREAVRVYQQKREELQRIISDHEAEISKLEKEIRDTQPRVPGARMECPRCDAISMAYVGRTPQGGLSGGDDVYECQLCGLDTESSGYESEVMFRASERKRR